MSKDSSKTEPATVAAPAPKEKKAALSWGPKAAIAVSIIAFVAAQIVAFYLISLWWFLGQGNTWAESTSRWLNGVSGQFVFVVISEVIVLSIIGWFLHRRKASFRQLGYSRQPGWDDLGFAVVGFVAYFGLLILVSSLVSAFTSVNFDQRQELGFEAIASSPEKIMALISLVVLPPLVEETVFRGFLFTGLRSKMTFVGTTVVTSIIFAAPHLFASSEGLLWIAGIDTFVLSLVLCYLREKTGALWAPIMVHAFKNSIAFILFLSYVAGN